MCSKLICFSLIFLSCAILISADSALQIKVDGRRESIDDSCSGATCTPFSKCKTWLQSTQPSGADWIVKLYPDGQPSPLSGFDSSRTILTDPSGNEGTSYFLPWPGSNNAISGPFWRGRLTPSVVSDQPFIIGTLGHKNFAISVYDGNGNLVIAVCNKFTVTIKYTIEDLSNPNYKYDGFLDIVITAEETPNAGCDSIYRTTTITTNNLPNIWYGPNSDTQGKCPYGPDCTGCGCEGGCNDRFTIAQAGLTDGVSFRLGSNVYFLSFLGFSRSAGEPIVTEFVTLEGKDNSAYLYATMMQSCTTNADCNNGVACSTGTCIDHRNAALNPDGYKANFCKFTYDDAKCKPAGDGCATGACTPAGCTTTPSNKFCANKLAVNAVCRTVSCDSDGNGGYSCGTHLVSGGCSAFASSNQCTAVCNTDGTCSCAPTTTTTTTTTTPTTTTTTTTPTTTTTTTPTTAPVTTTPTTTTTTTPTTTTTTTPTTTTTTTTTTTCGDPCALCNIPNGWTSRCDKCDNTPGFKNICVYNSDQGNWFLQNVPNAQVPSYFQTTLQQQQNFFPGERHQDVNGGSISSDCQCQRLTTTTTTTTPVPRSPLIQPTLQCVTCFSDFCYATLGYDARTVWADPLTPSSPVVMRHRGPNNFFTLDNSPKQLDLGQPDYFLRDLVTEAAIIKFPASSVLIWHLDGMTVSASSSSASVCARCDLPAEITVEPFTSDTFIGVTYSIDFSAVSKLCSPASPSQTHLILDLPQCPALSLAVSPPSCLRDDQTAPAPGYVPYISWDPSVVNPGCFYNNPDITSPFSIPLFSTPNCSQISITVSMDTAVCPSIKLGESYLSTLWSEACPNCQTCRTSPLFGIKSTCTPSACSQGQKFDSLTCKCEVCTAESLSCPPYSVPNLNSCTCVPCPTTCPGGYLLSATECCIKCPDPNDCTPCDPPVLCAIESLPSPDRCSCVSCTVPQCKSGYTLDSTRCGCVKCLPDGCPSGLIQVECDCVPVNITEPPTTPSPCPGSQIDICGVCGGNGKSCLGCDGKPGTGRWFDICLVECGDGSTCPNCVNDGCNVCTMPVDICGVCGGNGSTCLGCDGLPPTIDRPPTQYDQCGICGGNGTSCLGCAGVPFAGPCPSTVTAAAVGAVVSLAALAAIAGVIVALILLRLRKRPDLLYQSWDNTLQEYIAEIESNPLYTGQELDHNPLFN